MVFSEANIVSNLLRLVTLFVAINHWCQKVSVPFQSQDRVEQKDFDDWTVVLTDIRWYVPDTWQQ